MSSPGLYAGFATTPLPFAPGLPMAGYGTRTDGALGTHDVLEARCVWLQAGELALALVSVDLVAVDAQMVAAVRHRLADILPADGVILSATHTHAGPVVVRERIGSRTDQPGADRSAPVVEQQVEHVVRMARARARPARTGFARANVAGLGLNRRRPDGPADHTVTVLLLESELAEPVAALVRYSCHPTALDAGNRLYSADFPGIARREIEETTGVPAVFFNGTAGDVSTRFTRTESSFAEVGRFGQLLADAAVQALASVRPTETGPLRLANRQLTLPTRRLPGRAEAEQAVAEAEQRFESLCRQQVAASDRRVAETALFGARRTLRLVTDGLPATLDARVTAIQIGRLTLVTLPGEPFTEVGGEIVRRAGGDVAVLGYTNGYIGYLPTAHAQDGYEVGASVVSAAGVDLLVTAASELVCQVRRDPPEQGQQEET
jgi:hypothetical protein